MIMMLSLETVALAMSNTATITTKAIELRDRGFTVLTDTCMDAELLKRAAQASHDVLEERLKDVAKLGCEPLDQGYAFGDISHRARSRWDLAAPKEHGEITRAAMQRVTPIIEELHRLPVNPGEGGLAWARRLAPRSPKLLYTRALISRPGAPAQNFHVDQEMGWRSALLPSHRLFNVFVPLVDISADDDGTQFLPGSHLGGMNNALCTAAIQRSGRVVDDELAMNAMEAPGCPAGGIIIFDYRTLHRGLPNSGARVRPVAYGVCSTGWAKDRVNYPPLDVRDVVDNLPADVEERDLARRAIRGAHPLWSDIEEAQEQSAVRT